MRRPSAPAALMGKGKKVGKGEKGGKGKDEKGGKGKHDDLGKGKYDDLGKRKHDNLGKGKHEDQGKGKGAFGTSKGKDEEDGKGKGKESDRKGKRKKGGQNDHMTREYAEYVMRLRAKLAQQPTEAGGWKAEFVDFIEEEASRVASKFLSNRLGRSKMTSKYAECIMYWWAKVAEVPTENRTEWMPYFMDFIEEEANRVASKKPNIWSRAVEGRAHHST